jgi:alpha-beta hydrolase superfamily lysophospholipase
MSTPIVMNSTPEEHWVAADGGVGLHARVYRPSIPGGAGAPAITMAHGFSGLKSQGLIPFAERFVRAGFVVIVHDHRRAGRGARGPAVHPVAGRGAARLGHGIREEPHGRLHHARPPDALWGSARAAKQ